MAYHYEKLSPDDFQLFVQALLSVEFPGMQCLPVGMPDGGRDAIVFDQMDRDFSVVQVKLARKPHEIDDPLTWLMKVLDGELPKIQNLAKRGAHRYVLVTNLPGSSHLDVGLVDKFQSILNRKVPILAQCLWQNDLDVRLDRSFDLKLRYPQLLDGLDAIRLLWQLYSPDSDKERRSDALTAYLRSQFDTDSTVRFKQVELLTSSLFKLFIDVPALPAADEAYLDEDKLWLYSDAAVRLAKVNRQRRMSTTRSSTYNQGQDQAYRAYNASIYYTKAGRFAIRHTIGAADLLSDASFSSSARKIVLEGAPGQGKSTLVQYLAQLQRARLLERSSDLNAVPANHCDSPLAFPFKIELRDFALWLKGVDPWQRDRGSRHNLSPTLESAIAAHVQRYSGGAQFTVSDLHRVVRSVPILLLLDALDEVADLGDREKVVNEVIEAVNRLEELQPSLRVIITSRPTVLSEAPTFPRDTFTHLTLSAITRNLALDYTSRWAIARRLNQRDTDELKMILQEKLDSPHMADLAKNTMQLSILLSLILTRGASLPDKRTELYTAYLDLFLSRESEKSAVVRNNRVLLLGIHQHIAYYLHARAEGTQSNGRISVSELRAVIRDYLTTRGYEPDQLDALMFGMVERIVALVSRVEGTYEFEVQPLREYFAGKYLYDTAPYSPTGREQSGTKPDRFEGISPNPYWLNVTRFFAGCFSQGELLDLAQRVCDLVEDPKYRFSTYPRSLALSLLQDWVFSQSPRATNQLVETILDDVGIRWACTRNTYGAPFLAPGGTDLSLPGDAGGQRATEVIWNRLASCKERQTAIELALLLGRTSYSIRELKDRWFEEFAKRGCDTRNFWTKVGASLGIFRLFGDNEVSEVLSLGSDNWNERARYCVIGGAKLDYLSENDYLQVAIAVLAISKWYTVSRPAPPSDLRALHIATDPELWAQSVGRNIGAFHMLRETDLILKRQGGAPLNVPNQIVDAIQSATEVAADDILRNLSPWNTLVGRLEQCFGENWRSTELGIIAGAIKSTTERGKGADYLFDKNFPLPERVRNGRRRYKQVEWWASQADTISTNLDAQLWLAMVMVWAGRDVIGELIELIDRVARRLDSGDFEAVLDAATRGAVYSTRMRETVTKDVLDLSLNIGGRLLQLVMRRTSDDDTGRLIDHWMANGSPNESIATDFLTWMSKQTRLRKGMDQS